MKPCIAAAVCAFALIAAPALAADPAQAVYGTTTNKLAANKLSANKLAANTLALKAAADDVTPRLTVLSVTLADGAVLTPAR